MDERMQDEPMETPATPMPESPKMDAALEATEAVLTDKSELTPETQSILKQLSDEAYSGYLARNNGDQVLATEEFFKDALEKYGEVYGHQAVRGLREKAGIGPSVSPEERDRITDLTHKAVDIQQQTGPEHYQRQ